MKNNLRPLLIALVLAVTSFTTYAASIGVNLGTATAGQDNALNDGTTSASAGVVSQINWMNYSGTSAAAVALTDNLGALSGATMTFSGSNSIGSVQVAAGVDGTNGDEVLNNGYLVSFSNPLTFTISSVPYANYSLIAYIFPYPANNEIINGTVGATTYFLRSLNGGQTGPGYIDGNTGTAFNYLQGTGTTSGTATVNANYFLFTGLTSSTLTFTIDDDTNSLPSITGFQIIDTVPEPGSALLLLGGCCMLGLRRSRGEK